MILIDHTVDLLAGEIISQIRFLFSSRITTLVSIHRIARSKEIKENDSTKSFQKLEKVFLWNWNRLRRFDKHEENICFWRGFFSKKNFYSIFCFPQWASDERLKTSKKNIYRAVIKTIFLVSRWSKATRFLIFKQMNVRLPPTILIKFPLKISIFLQDFLEFCFFYFNSRSFIHIWICRNSIENVELCSMVKKQQFSSSSCSSSQRSFPFLFERFSFGHDEPRCSTTFSFSFSVQEKKQNKKRREKIEILTFDPPSVFYFF